MGDGRIAAPVDRLPIVAGRETQELLEVVCQMGMIGVAEFYSDRSEVCRRVGP